MNIHKIIRNIENIADIQLEIDLELMDNGGELTPELEAKQNSIDGLLETLVSSGTDEIISSVIAIGGKIDTLKAMRDNINASVKSAENLLERVKQTTGALLAKSEIDKARGDLGSISVRDAIVLDIYDKDNVEDEFKFKIVRFEKEDYNKVEFELAELITEVSKKDEVNETLLKKQKESKGAKIKNVKTITVYKKRTKKES